MESSVTPGQKTQSIMDQDAPQSVPNGTGISGKRRGPYKPSKAWERNMEKHKKAKLCQSSNHSVHDSHSLDKLENSADEIGTCTNNSNISEDEEVHMDTTHGAASDIGVTKEFELTVINDDTDNNNCLFAAPDADSLNNHDGENDELSETHSEELNSSNENDGEELNGMSAEEEGSEPMDSCDIEINNYLKEPLYENADVSVQEALILLMTLVRRHRMSDTALGHILTFLSILLPKDSKLPIRVNSVKNCFTSLSRDIKDVYYCAQCSELTNQYVDVCAKCGHHNQQNDFFIALPIAKQLHDILQDVLPDIQKYKTHMCNRNNDNNVIEDVMDGQLYKERFDVQTGYFKGSNPQPNECHISLQANSDGVSPFKSSKFQMWPFYLTINEIPPKMRFTRRCRIFPVMWSNCGPAWKSKPEWKSYLKHVSQVVQELHQNGFEFKPQNTAPGITIKALLLSGVFDLPAKCGVLNMIQYNGEFGCATCLEPGDSAFNLKGNSVHVYPFNTQSSRGFTRMRTHDSTVRTGLQVQDLNCAPINGIKGYSHMADCPGYDLIRSTTTEYMHDITLGVFVLELRLLLDSKFSKQPWYIGSPQNMAILNQRLKAITPPATVGRFPTSFDEYTKNKASENKVLLLFPFLPIMKGILPRPYFEHMAKLVEAVHILLGECIFPVDLQKARNLLIEFCREFPDLYHESFQTAKLHNLLHMVQKVVDLGPLWSHSAYFYEDLNKDLREMFHGTNNVQRQVLYTVAINHQLPILAKHLVPGSPVATFYEEMTSHHKIRSTLTKICNGRYSVGVLKPCDVQGRLGERLTAMFGSNLTFEMFERILLNRTVVHSIAYRQSAMKRNSFTISYRNETPTDTTIRYGHIRYYLKVIGRSTNYVAIVDHLPAVRNQGPLAGFLYPVLRSTNSAIVPIRNLLELAFFINVSPDYFVADFPNFIERE